jgi:phage-related protein
MTTVWDRLPVEQRAARNNAAARRPEPGAKPMDGPPVPGVAALQRLQAGAGNAAVSRLLAQRGVPAPPRGGRPNETGADEAVRHPVIPVQRGCGASCSCGPCQAGTLPEREEETSGAAAVQRGSAAGPATTAQLPAPRDDLDGHLDLLAGAALFGVPVVEAAHRAGPGATVQRFSLNPLDWAKKIWNGIKNLGSAALNTAKSLGGAALSKAVAFGSGVASTVGSAITGALSAVATAARSGLAKLGDVTKSALQTVGNLARNGLSAVGRVAKRALDGALRLGKAARDKAASVGRRALDVAMGAGRAVVDAGKSLASKAWGVVKGKVGGLWNGLKAKATALKNTVLSGAKGLLAKAVSLGGKAVDAAQGVADRIGGAICSAIGKATGWVYDKVAPLAKKAWEWVRENPAKALAVLLIPGGPLIALGVVLQKKMLEWAKQLFAPVVKAIAAKAKAAWNKAKQWGAKAFTTAKQWAGKALSGATALGKRAVKAAADFGRNVLGTARDLGGKVVGKAKEWGGKVLGTARDLGGKVWGQAKRLGGKLMGIADSLTGGLAGKVKGLADKMLGKAAGVLSWVLSKAKSLAGRALSSAKALASKVLSTAKDMASKAWGKAKDLGGKLVSGAKAFASSALAKGKDLLARAGKAAADFGKKAFQGAKNLAGRALATVKEWGAKAWGVAKDWGGKAWAKAKELGGKAWDWTKQKAGQAWEWAKGIGAKLAPFAKKAWEWAKKIGKAIGVDKAIAAVKSLGNKALDLAKKGLALLKDKVLPVVEKLRQARNKLMSYTAAGALCKAVGCAYKGVMPKAGKTIEGGADLATDLIPVVSTVKDTCTCLVGENFVTNEKVGMAEQGMACAFAAIDIAGYAAAPFTGGATAAGAIALRTTLKGGIKVGGKILAKEALEAAIKKGGRELAERLGREGLQELAEKLGKEGLQSLAERMGKEEFEKLAKEAAEQGVKGFDDIFQRGAKEAGEQAAKEAAGEGAEKAGKEGAEKALASGRQWAADTLRLSGEILKDLALDAIERLKKLPEWAMERLRSLSNAAKRTVLGCASPCKVDLDEILEHLKKLPSSPSKALGSVEDVIKALPPGINPSLIEKKLLKNKGVLEAIKAAGLTGEDLKVLEKFLTGADKLNPKSAYETFTRALSHLLAAKTGGDITKLHELAGKMAGRGAGAALKGSMFESFVRQMPEFSGMGRRFFDPSAVPGLKKARNFDLFEDATGAMWEVKYTTSKVPANQVDDYARILAFERRAKPGATINYLFATKEMAEKNRHLMDLGFLVHYLDAAGKRVPLV